MIDVTVPVVLSIICLYVLVLYLFFKPIYEWFKKRSV